MERATLQSKTQNRNDVANRLGGLEYSGEPQYHQHQHQQDNYYQHDSRRAPAAVVHVDLTHANPLVVGRSYCVLRNYRPSSTGYRLPTTDIALTKLRAITVPMTAKIRLGQVKTL